MPIFTIQFLQSNFSVQRRPSNSLYMQVRQSNHYNPASTVQFLQVTLGNPDSTVQCLRFSLGPAYLSTHRVSVNTSLKKVSRVYWTFSVKNRLCTPPELRIILSHIFLKPSIFTTSNDLILGWNNFNFKQLNNFDQWFFKTFLCIHTPLNCVEFRRLSPTSS